MSVIAKCHQYTGCLLAYRGEEIPLAEGAPLVCPECGKPVTVVPKNAKFLRVLPWVIFFALLAAGAIVALPFIRARMAKSSAEDVSAEHRQAAGTPAAGGTAPHPVAPENSASEASAPPIAPAKIELNPERQETRAVRDDVLQRIDLIPNITPVNKDKLYISVQRARSMGLVLTVPFASGRTAISAAEIPALKTALEAPAVMKLRDDPTAVFVVLGYADAKGDEKKNLHISQERADSVVAAMRDKCAVGNVSHAVAMGGSKLHDSGSPEKNRIVEIWAVLP